MVIAERKDADIKQWRRTNSEGYLVTEYSNIVTNTAVPDGMQPPNNLHIH